jgi:hypothetical protein
MKQADLKDTLKKASKSVHIFSTATSSNTLSPTPAMPTAMTVPKNKQKDPEDPEPADETDTKVNNPLTNCTAQV